MPRLTSATSSSAFLPCRPSTLASNPSAILTPSAFGFDASVEGRHGKNAEELVALVNRGMSPLQVIRAATLNGAELAGLQDDVAAVESGRYADLIAVRGDPLTDIPC